MGTPAFCILSELVGSGISRAPPPAVEVSLQGELDSPPPQNGIQVHPWLGNWDSV